MTFIFLQICELGNLSIHWALRCLRPAGSKGMQITSGGLKCDSNEYYIKFYNNSSQIL